MSKKKNTANNAKKTAAAGGATVKYRAKRKIPLTLLLALTAPLTVCFFGPFETYCGNIGEFVFSLGDFLPACLAVCAALSALLFTVLMLLDGMAYNIACAVTVWLSTMLFVQRYYLNFGVNALAGDGVGSTEAPVITVVLTSVLWIVIGALAIFAAVWLGKKNIAPFFVGCAVVLILILATQAVGFGALSFSTDVYTPVAERGDEGAEEAREPSVLTFENLNEVSSNKNVIFFLIDRFDVRYFENLQKTDPEFLEGLDGFTFYNDYTSLYCRTYPAITSIITGAENSFEDTRLNYFKDAYTDGGHLRAMHESGYTVNLYTEKYYAYDDAWYMKDYVDNVSGVNGYEIDSNAALGADMLRLSLSTCLPFVLKDSVGSMSTPEFNAHAVYEMDEDVYDTANMKEIYEYLSENELVKTETNGQFSFIHIYGCHTPVKHNLNWEEANDKEKNDTTMALKQSLTIIYKYIEQMKELGVYEDATIVIAGDHPAALSDTKLIGEASKSDNGTRVTAMLFKRSGDSGTPMVTSKAQISQDELWNTIYESEGILSLKDGDSFFDIGEDEQRTRRYLFELSVKLGDNERADEIVEYEITGSARDKENWSIKKRTVIGKIYK